MITPDRILLLFGMFACSLGAVPPQTRDLEVLGATSQEWISGVPGGGRGITYRLTIKIKTSRPVTFDALWVAGKKLDTQPVKAAPSEPSATAGNGVVTLRASSFRGRSGLPGRHEEQKPEPPPADAAKAPVAYQGAALLRYEVQGTARYVAIPEITVLPTIYGQ